MVLYSAHQRGVIDTSGPGETSDRDPKIFFGFSGPRSLIAAGPQAPAFIREMKRGSRLRVLGGCQHNTMPVKNEENSPEGGRTAKKNRRERGNEPTDPSIEKH